MIRLASTLWLLDWSPATTITRMLGSLTVDGVLLQTLVAAVGYLLRIVWERISGATEAREKDFRARNKLLHDRELELELSISAFARLVPSYDELLSEHLRARDRIAELEARPLLPPHPPGELPEDAMPVLQAHALRLQGEVARLEDQNRLLRQRLETARAERAELHAMVQHRCARLGN